MNLHVRILLGLLGVMACVLLVLLAISRSGSSALLDIPAIGDGSIKGSVPISSVTRIDVAMGGRAVHIDRSSESDWLLGPPAGARADRAAVDAILGLFARGLRSDINSDIGGDPAAFGMDSEHVIALTVTGVAGQILALEIGTVQTFQDRPPDTFVRIRGDRKVFRVTGRNLREPFQGGIESMRSRRLFSFGPAAVRGIDFFNPAAPDQRDRVLMVELDTVPGSAGFEGQELISRRWKFLEPAGYETGGTNVLAGQIAGLMAVGYSDGLPEGVIPGDQSPRVVIHLADGSHVNVVVSQAVDGFVWVDAGSGFARLRESDAACLVRTLADLRDTSLLQIAREDVVKLSWVGADGRYQIERRGNSFVVTGDLSVSLDRTAIEAWLTSLAGMKASRMVRPDDESDRALATPSVELTIAMRDGTSQSVRVALSGVTGKAFASVGGEPDIYVLDDAQVSTIGPALDSLRRKELIAGGAASVASISVFSGDGRRVTLSPPANAGQQWKAVSADGSEVESPLVTAVAGGAMSLTVESFTDIPASSVRADAGRVEFAGRDFKVVLKVSSRTRGASTICAATGDAAFAARAFLVPTGIIESILALVDIGGR